MPTLTYRRAGEESVDLLATMHRRLLAVQSIEDRRTEAETSHRLRTFLSEDYQAVVFEFAGSPVGYALYRPNPRYVLVRHFYVDTAVHKRVSVESAFQLLRRGELKDYASIRIDVPEANKETIGIWESAGFVPRSVRLELNTAKKETNRFSCGAVVYRLHWRTPEYLIVKHADGGHWGFPKGHTVVGETEIETAAREIYEEVGLVVAFRDGFLERLSYLNGKQRRKEVILFLARARGSRIRLQRDEIDAALWLPYWAARDRLTFENTKVSLDRAKAYLEERRG